MKTIQHLIASSDELNVYVCRNTKRGYNLTLKDKASGNWVSCAFVMIPTKPDVVSKLRRLGFRNIHPLALIEV